METTLEIVEGMQFDKGYISPYFVTNPEKMEAVVDEPLILINEKKISSMKDLLPILEQVAKMGKTLLIIAEDVEGEASRLSWSISSVHHQGRGSEGSGIRRQKKGHARRYRHLTGGQLISEELGIKLESIP